MKAIFEEAIEQKFVEKNPARKLILPKQLQPLRDRILLTLDMTETFRPSWGTSFPRSDDTVEAVRQQ